jgi:hypothetical protein
VRAARLSTAAAVLACVAALAAGAGASHDSIDLVSIGPAGGNGAATAAYAGASEDGTRVFLQTVESLVAADTDGRTDVYERAGGVTTLVSTGSAGGNGAFNAFFSGASADGKRVFFGTSERLEPGDTDGQNDVYERANGATTLVSTGPAGGNGAIAAFFDGASGDGTRVLFHTNERLVAADTDSQADIYERASGSTALVSTGPAGGNGAFPAFFGGSSLDGSQVFFETSEQLTANDTDSSQDVFERDGGTTVRSSIWGTGGNGAFDAFYDGNTESGNLVWFSTEEALAAGDCDDDEQFDVYSRHDDGSAVLSSDAACTGGGPFDAAFVDATPDGGQVFFETEEQLVSADTDNFHDVYQGGPRLVSTGPAGGNGAFDAQFAGVARGAPTAPFGPAGVAPDERLAFFETEESLVAADTDAQVDVYSFNHFRSPQTELVSTGPAGGNGTEDATFDGVSDDGARAFFSTAESLVGADTDAARDVYEREPAATTLLSTGPTGGNGALDAQYAGQGRDGRAVFLSTSEQLVAADTDASADIYVTRDHGGYARPKGATPLYASLVPAYQPCGAPNRMHGPPLAFGSCAPPAQASAHLTVGTPDANDNPAGSVGFLRLNVEAGDPSIPGDDADVGIAFSLTDVRRSTDLADYTGELEAAFEVRLTDRFNGSSPTDPGTVADFPFTFVVPCGATGGSEGGACPLQTSFDAVVPGSVPEGARAIWQLGQVEVRDGGADGLAATGPNTVFARQGIFVP